MSNLVVAVIFLCAPGTEPQACGRYNATEMHMIKVPFGSCFQAAQELAAKLWVKPGREFTIKVVCDPVGH